MMLAWVSQRREDGAKLAEAFSVWNSTAVELLIVNVTDQGNHRPMKVARVRPVGEQRIVGELLSPKLVLLDGWEMLLSGLQEKMTPLGRKGSAQTWHCRLTPPNDAIGFKITSTCQDGVVLPKRALYDASKSKGHIRVFQQFNQSMRRCAMHAELAPYLASTCQYPRLVDCDLRWMSEERFELGGLRVVCQQKGRPEYLTRDGWLCEFDMAKPELTKAQARQLR
jgi:hypothetical protein